MLIHQDQEIMTNYLKSNRSIRIGEKGKEAKLENIPGPLE